MLVLVKVSNGCIIKANHGALTKEVCVSTRGSKQSKQAAKSQKAIHPPKHSSTPIMKPQNPKGTNRTPESHNPKPLKPDIPNQNPQTQNSFKARTTTLEILAPCGGEAGVSGSLCLRSCRV